VKKDNYAKKKITKKKTKMSSKYAEPIYIGKKVPKNWNKLPRKDNNKFPIHEFDPERVIITYPETREIPGGDAGQYVTDKWFYIYPDNTYGYPIFYSASGNDINKPRQLLSYGIQPDNIGIDGDIKKDDSGREKPLRGYNTTIRWNDKKNKEDTKLAKRDNKGFVKLLKLIAKVVAEDEESLDIYLPKLADKNPSPEFLIENDDPKYLPSILWQKTMKKEKIKTKKGGEREKLISLPREEWGPLTLKTGLIYWPKKKEMDTTFKTLKEYNNNPLDKMWSQPFYCYPRFIIQGNYGNQKYIKPRIRISGATVWPAPRQNYGTDKINEDDLDEVPVSYEESQKILKQRDSDSDDEHVSKRKSKKKSIIDENELSDDEPVSKRKSKKKSKKIIDENELSDDEPLPRRKSKKKSKKVNSDDELSDDDPQLIKRGKHKRE